MKQFDFFDGLQTITSVSKKKQGRPKSVTPEIVFETKKLLSLKKKTSNEQIIRKLNLSKSTFFRIKKGDYDDLFQQYLKSTIQNFSLTQEDA